VRSDTERNRRRLIKAAAFLVSRHGINVKMVDVAERAEVATATAYRHFSSVDEILAEYRFDVGLRLLEFSQKCDSTGVTLLTDVSREWVRLVVKHGGAMVHTRSDVGYLERLRSGARYLTVQADALQRPIAEAATELGLSDPGDEGMFLWNILFDPREVFDLLRTVGLSEERVAARLVGAFCGAIAGWQRVRDDLPVAG
jgi:AcrR family transcriptional regulator